MLAAQVGRVEALQRRLGKIHGEVLRAAHGASEDVAGGVALRFARIKGYRPDKPAGEADTIGMVQALLT